VMGTSQGHQNPPDVCSTVRRMCLVSRAERDQWSIQDYRNTMVPRPADIFLHPNSITELDLHRWGIDPGTVCSRQDLCLLYRVF